ncbi:MAG: TlpA family protein disulfide reductase [Thermomicrobiales bacterium]|nr:TlpA family protein disulfide reductase [Thermomicrobiales bacterium]
MKLQKAIPHAGLMGTLALLVALLAACGGGGGGDPAFGLIDYPDSPGEVSAQPGDFAPNFRLELSDGGEIVFADELGTPILLNFFASWCTNCKEEMTALDAIDGQGVKVIGIDFQEGADKVLALAEETGATFPMALDLNGKVSREYRATSLPVTLVIGADGRVLDYIRGPVDEAMLAEILESLGVAS